MGELAAGDGVLRDQSRYGKHECAIQAHDNMQDAPHRNSSSVRKAAYYAGGKVRLSAQVFMPQGRPSLRGTQDTPRIATTQFARVNAPKQKRELSIFEFLRQLADAF